MMKNDKKSLPVLAVTSKIAVQSVPCPACGAAVNVTDALGRDVERQLAAEFRAKLDLAIREEQKKAQAEANGKLEFNLNEIDRLRDELKTATARELEIGRRERQLKDAEQRMAIENERKLGVEYDRIRATERERLTAQFNTQKAQMEAELTLMRQAQQLSGEQVQNAIDRALSEAGQKHAVALQQRQLQIERLTDQIASLQRRTEVTSPELRGEALEIRVRDLLHQLYPMDEVTDVGRGRNGADIHQRIRNSGGQVVGSILWEVKNASTWQAAWTSKLQIDVHSSGCDVGVLVSTILPKGLDQFGTVDGGVWVCSIACLGGLSGALRQGLMRVAAVRTISTVRESRVQELLAYFQSPEFRTGIELVLATVRKMSTDLQAEKQAMNRIWAAREKQLQRLGETSTRVIGSIEHMVEEPSTSAGHLLAMCVNQQEEHNGNDK